MKRSEPAPLDAYTPACRRCGGSDGLRQAAFGGVSVTLCAGCARAAESGRLEYRLSRAPRRRLGPYADPALHGAARIECSVDGGPWRVSRPHAQGGPR